MVATHEDQHEAIDATLADHDSQLGLLRRNLDRQFQEIMKISLIIGAHTNTLAEHSAILAEHSAILAEHSAILAEHSERLERIEQQLREIQKVSATVDEHSERLQRIEDKLDRALGLDAG